MQHVFGEMNADVRARLEADIIVGRIREGQMINVERANRRVWYNMDGLLESPAVLTTPRSRFHVVAAG